MGSCLALLLWRALRLAVAATGWAVVGLPAPCGRRCACSLAVAVRFRVRVRVRVRVGIGQT
eukprot:3560486-Heterocapsa_arctica.AAC.1